MSCVDCGNGVWICNGGSCVWEEDEELVVEKECRELTAGSYYVWCLSEQNDCDAELTSTATPPAGIGWNLLGLVQLQAGAYRISCKKQDCRVRIKNDPNGCS